MAKLDFEAIVQQEVERESEDELTLDITLGSNVKGRYDETASNFVYHQTMPSEALFAMIIAQSTTAASVGDKARAMWDFFEGTLPQHEYAHLRARITGARDIDLARIMEAFERSIEFWSQFPTQPQSDSSGLRQPTGSFSTGRAPGPGSTHSTSGALAAS